MTEKQILKKISKWDEEDKISAIIDFVEKLPVEEKTSAVLSELGRAYNNAYWLNPSQENRKYLQKAVDVFNYIKGSVDEYSWNYRIGYSYFFLDNIEKAKEHLSQTEENNSRELLSFVALAEEKGLNPTEIAPKGMLKDEFLIEKFIKLVNEKAKPLANILEKGVTDAELNSFEQKIGVQLPEIFRLLHKSFSGQTDNNVLFFNNSQRFVALSEIESLQDEHISFLEQHYGQSWKKKRFSSDDFLDDDVIKNQLFSKKWLPVLVRKSEDNQRNEFLCIDLDPLEKEDFGQLISVTPSDTIENYFVDYVEANFYMWLLGTTNSIEDNEIVYDENENSFMFTNNEGNFEPSFYEEADREALEEYISDKLGKFDDVFHELVSPDIHCDVYIIKPTPERNYYSLVTGGVGAFDMFTPDSYEGSPNIELMINLPPDWDLKSQDEKDYWPIRWLKVLGRLPIEQQTYLGWGHTVPTGAPIEGTAFNCFMLVDTYDKNGNLAEIKLPNGKTVWFYTLMPLYEDEMLYKLENGAEALTDKFQERNFPYPPVVDVNRENTCEAFKPSQNNSALNDVAWAFNKYNYAGLMQFWDEVKGYNEDIENDLEFFNPFATIFDTPKVKVIYQAWIKSEKDLFSIEKLVENPEEVFEEGNDEDGYYQAEIIAEFESGDGKVFGALELLWNIQNCLQNKELGDHIFFEGFDIEGYEDDGTPVLYLYLGS